MSDNEMPDYEMIMRAFLKLPSPPLTPKFARETERPKKNS